MPYDGGNIFEMGTKLLIILVPLLASALALSYDVGYFYGVDIHYFSVFSLSEHTGFALEALPFSLAGLAMGVASAVSFRLGYEHAESAKRAGLEPLFGWANKIERFYLVEIVALVYGAFL